MRRRRTRCRRPSPPRLGTYQAQPGRCRRASDRRGDRRRSCVDPACSSVAGRSRERHRGDRAPTGHVARLSTATSAPPSPPFGCRFERPASAHDDPRRPTDDQHGDQGHGNPARPAVVAVDGTRRRDGRAVPISGPDRAVELDLIEAAAELCCELAQSIRWPAGRSRRWEGSVPARDWDFTKCPFTKCPRRSAPEEVPPQGLEP